MKMARWIRIKNWKKLAIELYFKQHGRRCVKCSDPVSTHSAALYKDGFGNVALTHDRMCPRRK